DSILDSPSRPLRSLSPCSSSSCLFFFSSRRRHTRSKRDWSSDVCSSDLSGRNRGHLALDEGHCVIDKLVYLLSINVKRHVIDHAYELVNALFCLIPQL